MRLCDTVKNLDFTLDSHLTLEQQVKECFHLYSHL